MAKLLFIPHSVTDFNKMESAIDNSDFYAEVNHVEKYFSFEENDVDALEIELDNLITPKGINGHFEIED